MKELSIEEKAKRYDEAIKRARTKLTNEVASDIFPELKESEGEKVRKKVIDVLKLNVKGAESQMQASRGVDRTFEVYACNKVVAWLEKQGEQKPIFDVEIPFGAKDSELEEVFYSIPNGFHAEIEDNKVIIKKGEKKSAEWSIFDYRTWLYIVSDVLTKKKGVGLYLNDDTCKKIAKYMQEEWSKKLSVEQRTTELPKGQDYGIDGLYAAIDILTKTLGEVVGYQSDDGILTHKCAISAVKELSKQKPAWTEEDETGLTNTIIMLKEGASLHFNKKDITKAVDWLKDRVQPQPKQGWSEEDEHRIKLLEALCEDKLLESLPNSTMYEEIKITIDWLKSLRPQTT